MTAHNVVMGPTPWDFEPPNQGYRAPRIGDAATAEADRPRLAVGTAPRLDFLLFACSATPSDFFRHGTLALAMVRARASAFSGQSIADRADAFGKA